MKESRDFIVSGIKSFQAKWQLAWPDITVVTAGDILASLSQHQLLYSTFNWDYVVYRPDDLTLAKAIAAEFAALGAEVIHDQQFGGRVWIAAFSRKTTASQEPWPNLPEAPDWRCPLVNRRILNSAALPGEFTPFRFKGVDYRLENVLAHYVIPYAAVGARSHENHFRIRRESDDRLVSIPLLNHYFASAYVWQDRCYCFSMNQGAGRSRLEVIVSDDLITWEAPRCVFDFTDIGEHFCNTSVTYDGKRFVLLFETDDPAYPIYTFKFAESDDLLHWRQIPGAIYGWDKYVGGGTLHWIKEDGLYYLSTLDLFIHPTERKVSYRFILSRSKDLIHWEDAPEDRPLLLPDYNHRPDPVRFPEVFEISVSDMEYRELDGFVRAYYIGGNQWGICDNQVAEYHGSLRDFFHEFYR